MTPQEKATQLFKHFLNAKDDLLGRDNFSSEQDFLIAKENSIFCVNEIINSNSCEFDGHENMSTDEYWLKVKEEFE